MFLDERTKLVWYPGEVGESINVSRRRIGRRGRVIPCGARPMGDTRYP